MFCYHRFRACQLIAKMMSYAADAQTKIGPDRLDRVQEVMMQRLYDKVSPYVILYLVEPAYSGHCIRQPPPTFVVQCCQVANSMHHIPMVVSCTCI